MYLHIVWRIALSSCGTDEYCKSFFDEITLAKIEGKPSLRRGLTTSHFGRLNYFVDNSLPWLGSPGGSFMANTLTCFIFECYLLWHSYQVQGMLLKNDAVWHL